MFSAGTGVRPCTQHSRIKATEAVLELAAMSVPAQGSRPPWGTV